MKKLLFIFTVTTLSIIAFAQHMKNKSTEEKALEALLRTMETGWNNANGETFSSVFAEVHDYIVVNGLYFPGNTRKINAAMHQNLFDHIYKGTEIKLKTDKIVMLRSDLALITALGARFEKGKGVPEDPKAIMTILAEKKNDSWQIISFHNHDIDSSVKDNPIKPMKVMYASWYNN